MADTKVSALTNYLTPLAADVLPIVDTANTTTKKVTFANLESHLNRNNLTGTLSVANGGTGAATLTGVLVGAGTSAVTAVAAPTGTIVGTSDTQTLTGKTLTSPKIGTSILDTNGNALMNLTATGSAVNNLTNTNAATGSNPALGATGSDTDVGLNLTTKGAGAVQANGVTVATISGTQTLTNKTLTSPTLTTPALGTPASGMLTHATGLPEGGLSLTDITTANVSTSAHGFAPKAPNDATKYLDGTGAYSVPAGGGGSGISSATANGAVYATAATTATSTAALTNGQILVGSTGTTPVAATITQGSGITVTNGAGTITIAATAGGGGTVTASGGSLTANDVVLGAGTTDTKVVAGITTDGTSKLNLGVAGASVGSTVFANATSGTITLSPVTGALGAVTLSLPAATDTLVGKATTDTLTNKTLTSPTLTTPDLGTPASGVATNLTSIPAANLLIGSQATGDILYASSASVWSRLAKGSDTQVLTLVSGVPSWAAGGGGVTFTEVTGTTQTASVNTGYVLNNASLVTVTLPTTAAVGDRVYLAGKGAGLYKVAQNASQLIHTGDADTTTGTGGSLTALGQYNSIELMCITANTDWLVFSERGKGFTIT